jgi:hypothetical protein
MNVERVLTIARAVLRDLEATSVGSKLRTLADELQRRIDSPADPSFQTRTIEQRDALVADLRDAESNEFTSIWSDQLDELGLGRFIAPALLARLEASFSTEELSPATVRDEVSAMADEVAELESALQQAIRGLEFLRVPDETLAAGEFEVSVLVPRVAVHNSLDELSAELHEIDLILQPFLELGTGGREPIKVRSISSSDFGAFLQFAPEAAYYFALAIDKLVDTIGKVISMRRHRDGLIEDGVPEEALTGVVEAANGMMASQIEKLVDDFIEQSARDVNEPRTHELRIGLRVSLEKTAERIESSYHFDVSAGPALDEQPEGAEGEAEEEPIGAAAEDQAGLERRREINRMRAGVLSAQKRTRLAQLDGQPILSLLSAYTTAHDEDQGEQQPQ